VISNVQRIFVVSAAGAALTPSASTALAAVVMIVLRYMPDPLLLKK